MATRRRRRAEVEDPELQEQVTAPEPGSAEIIPPVAAPRDEEMDFFDYLDNLPAASWEDLMVYIYRQEPAVRNTGDGHYIEKVPHSIDEEYIKSHHGGGRFLVFLKNIRTKERVRSKSFVIDGLPKLLEGQTLIDPRTKEPIPSPTAAQAPSGSAMSEHTLAEVVMKAISAVQQQKMPADEAIRTALDTLGQAQKGAMDIVLSAAKSQAASTTGHPMMDKLLEKALERMVTEAPPVAHNPIESFKDMLATVRELQGLTGESAPRRGGLLEEVKAVSELLKGDADGTIKSLIFGRGDGEEQQSGVGQLFSFLGKAIERRPDIIDSLASGLSRIVSSPSTTNTARQVIVHQTPALGQPSEHPQPQPGQSAATEPVPASELNQPTEQTVVNAILQTIVNAFQGEYSGKATADSIRVLFPQAVPELAKYLEYPDAAIGMWLRQQPVMAPILDNPEFPDFFMDFKHSLLHPEEAGEDNSQAQSVGAGS